MIRSAQATRLLLLAAMLVATGLALAVPTTAHASRLWIRQWGSVASDGGTVVATDVVGNVYLAGTTAGSLGGPNKGSTDAWVAKYDPAGHVVWKRQLGTAEFDVAYGITTDTAANVYLTGQTRGSLGGPNKGGSDAWVAKYDSIGHLLWKRQLGSADGEGDIGYGVATDAADDLYVAGVFGGTNGPAFVAKYDAVGHLLWLRQVGESTQFHGVATDASGNVYAAGLTSDWLRAPDAFVAKYDAAGHLLWTRHFGATDIIDYANGVATDTASNVYLTGETYAASDRSDTDVWVAKLDAAGHLLWKRQFAGINDGLDVEDLARSVATDSADNVYLTGTTLGALDGSSRGGRIDADAWLAKYDTAGNRVWLQQFGTPKDDAGNGVATDGAGHVYVAGSTDGSLCGTNRGGSDPFVAKYSTEP